MHVKKYLTVNKNSLHIHLLFIIYYLQLFFTIILHLEFKIYKGSVKIYTYYQI